MYTVWTRPSTARGGRKTANPAARSTRMAVGNIMIPAVTHGVLAGTGPVAMGSTISLAATSGGALRQVKNLGANISPAGTRRTRSRAFSGTTYYEHARHGSKQKADGQATSLRRLGYSVRVTQS